MSWYTIGTGHVCLSVWHCIFSKRTGKRFERWDAKLHQAWLFTNTCKHIP
jgi:hypothetical protein